MASAALTQAGMPWEVQPEEEGKEGGSTGRVERTVLEQEKALRCPGSSWDLHVLTLIQEGMSRWKARPPLLPLSWHFFSLGVKLGSSFFSHSLLPVK